MSAMENEKAVPVWTRCAGVCKRVLRTEHAFEGEAKICRVCAGTPGAGNGPSRTIIADTDTRVRSLLAKGVVGPGVARTPTERAITRVSVAKYRDTDKGKDYTVRYRQARTIADRRLREAHPDEWAQMMDEARREVGLV